MEDKHEQFHLLMDLLERQVPIRVLSYGEGEYAFIFDREPGSTREVFTEEMRLELLSAMEWAKKPNIYFTTILDEELNDPPLRSKIETLIADMYLELKPLRDAKVFYRIARGIYEKDLAAREAALSFVRFLRGKTVTLVGGKHLRRVLPFLNSFVLIETPTYGATAWVDKIEKEILESPKTDLYLFHAGVVSNALIHRLSEQLPDASLIDVGSFWDLLLGIGTRAQKEFEPPLVTPEML